MSKETILNFLKNKYFHYFLLILVCLMIFNYSCQEQKRLENELLINKQNSLSLIDSVKIYKDKVGILRIENYTYIGKLSNLDDYSKNLKNKIDSLKKGSTKKIEVVTIKEANISIKGFANTSTNTINEFDGQNGIFKWNFSEKETGYERILSGQTNYKIFLEDSVVSVFPGKTTILNDLTTISIYTYTVLNPDKTISIIANSESDKVNINHIRQVIDPEILKRMVDIYIPEVKNDIVLTWGIQAGVGVSSGSLLPVGYVGVGLQFQLGTIFKGDIPKWLKF